MRITFCAYDFVRKVGGPLSWIARLLPALSQQGLEVSLLLLSEDESKSPLIQKIRHNEIKITSAPFSLSTESKVSWILDRIRDDPPDVFVANLCVPALFAAGWIRDSGIPTVGVLHSDDGFYREVQKQFVFGRHFFRLSAVVCVSKFLEAFVKRRAPADTKVFRVPYGVPIPARAASLPPDGLKLLYVGRLVEEQKRIFRVVKAFCAATKDLRGVSASLLGEGRKQVAIENYVRDECKDCKVSLLGSVPPEEVQDVMLDHHVIALLSDYEGLPISLLEGMACGLVPVCTAIRSGIPEVVEDGVEGLLVDPTEEAFVAAIKKLKDNPRLWKQMSMNSRSRVEREFGTQASLKLWHELINDLGSHSAFTGTVDTFDANRLPRTAAVFAHEDKRETSRFRLWSSRWRTMIGNRKSH